jgi:uncharacterized phage-associated protein
MSDIDKNKYKNILLYLVKRLGGTLEGKKKLYKLLYYVDFDFFEKHEKKIVGDVYKKLEMGPVPISCDNIASELAQEKKLRIEEKELYPGYLPTTIYTILADPDINIFTKEEIEIIDRVIDKYGKLNGKDLERLTHNEAPFIATATSAVIEYENAFYRGTFDEDEGA